MLFAILTIGSVSASDDLNETALPYESSDGVDMLNANENAILEDEILNEDSKTFADLNATINGNSDNEVYLNGNYAYSPNCDSDLINGIVINRDVTIHGNGAILNGMKTARMFNVTNGNVVFHDLTFVNGYSKDNGGAICGSCTAVNCTFNNNSVVDISYSFTQTIYLIDGGAMYLGTAVNCTFNKNSASGKGGAIYNGTAYNCTFNNNTGIYSFSSGGAMYESVAYNCTFNQNSANEGGAMYESVAYNCTFNQNSAKNGGAMYESAAYNCTFNNNSATNAGGASFNSHASNCVFENNSAANGGAMSSGSAQNCTFINNNATEGGSDVYNSEFNNCTFENNNSASQVNGSTLEPKLTVNDYASTYNSGEKLLVTVTDYNGNVQNNVNITLKVTKGNELIGTYYFLSGDGWLVSLDAGTYNASISVQDEGYDSCMQQITLKINPIPTRMTLSNLAVVYKSNKNVIITLKDDKGNPISGALVSISFNGVNNLKTNKNGQILLSASKLTPKSYAISATFNDGNYIKSTVSSKVTVKKATAKITAKAKKFKKSLKVKKYTITLKSGKTALKNMKVKIKIKGKIYRATTNYKGKATFKIKKLTKKGTYKSKITFNGNKYYYKATKTVKIKIK